MLFSACLKKLSRKNHNKCRYLEYLLNQAMSKTKKTFSQPKGRSNALDNVQTTFVDPKAVDYRSLKEGEGIVVRILSLASPEQMVIQPIAKAACASAKHLDSEPLMLWVPLPEDPDDADNIFDDKGVPLSDGQESVNWFIPVFTLYKVDKDGIISEEVEEIQYLKAGPGMVKDIATLSKDIKNDFEFDAIPAYDIRIEMFKNGSITNWSLHPVTKILTKNGKKIEKESCPRFGIEDLEEALGSERWQYIVDNIDEIMEHYTEVAAKERTVASIKKRFLKYRTNSNDDAKTRSVGMPRDLPKADEESEDADAGEEGTSEETPKFRGLGKGRFNK